MKGLGVLYKMCLISNQQHASKLEAAISSVCQGIRKLGGKSRYRATLSTIGEEGGRKSMSARGE